jgi:hypothetical protein
MEKRTTDAFSGTEVHGEERKGSVGVVGVWSTL